MKAAITKSYGPPSAIELVQIPKPLVGSSDVMIKVRACAVTEGDRRLRAADFPGFSALFGRLAIGMFSPRHALQGTMFAGQVVAIGADVTEHAVGDDVFGSVDHGAYAECLVVPETGKLAKIPEGVSYAEAASVPYGAVTALMFLRDIGSVVPGERVLVLGASGGVGRYAVQLAKHLGAEVTGVCSARNADSVRSFGADHVIDYATTDFTKTGETYDVVFDVADATSFRQCRSALSDNGRYLTLYVSLRVLWAACMTSIIGGPKAKTGVAMGSRDELQAVAELVASGALRPVVDAQLPFDRIVDAHEAIASTAGPGSLVLEMA